MDSDGSVKSAIKYRWLNWRKIPLSKWKCIRIDDYKTSPRQNEMHHMNSDVKTSVNGSNKCNSEKEIGIIPMDQEANRFLIETLEPARGRLLFCLEFLWSHPGSEGRIFRLCIWRYRSRLFEKQCQTVKTKLEQRRATDTASLKAEGRNWILFMKILPGSNRHIYATRSIGW